LGGDKKDKADTDDFETEKDMIIRVLQELKWHYGNACKALNISRPTLNKKLKEYGITPKPRHESG